VQGDTLSGISATAYGNGKEWRRIWQANQTRLPGIVEIDALKAGTSSVAGITGQDATITIGDRAIPMESCSVMRSIDTALDGWSMVTHFDPNDNEMYNLLRPYQYQKSQVYLGKTLAGTGYYFTPETDTGSQRATLHFWSKPAHMMDSTLKPGTYEANKIKLSQRAADLAQPHAVKVIYELDEDGIFDRIKANKTEKKGDHLLNLARQRGGLVTSTENGELLFTQAATGEPVLALIENTPPLLPVKSKYDGRARYGSYLAIGQSTGKAKSATAVDENIPHSRFLTFTADDTRGGDIQTAAEWKKNKTIADSLSIDLPLSDWFDFDGNLIKENTIIEVFAPTLFINRATRFLIRSATYEYTVDNGRTMTINVVPPGVYNDEPIEEPWLNSA
jgi:hypothetical protein